eukprot:UN0356
MLPVPSAARGAQHGLLQELQGPVQNSLTIASLTEGVDYSCSPPGARFEELNMAYFRTRLHGSRGDVPPRQRHQQWNVHEDVLIGGSRAFQRCSQ